MYYGNKLREKTYNTLMTDEKFVEFAKEEYQTRVKVGAFCLRDTFEKDVFDNIESYEDQWGFRQLADRLKADDPVAIQAAEQALKDVLKEFDFV